MTVVSITVVKTLFALSRNVCAYPRCEHQLTDPKWKEVAGQIAHICGEKAGSARFDPSMSEADRWAFENLIVLCPWCHTVVDRLEPDAHSVEILRKIKEQHEQRADATVAWASEKELALHALRLILQTPGIEPDRPEDLFPIADYDDLSAGEITPLLPMLYADEVDLVINRERHRAGGPRRVILERLEQVRASLVGAPDDLTAEEWIAQRDADASTREGTTT